MFAAQSKQLIYHNLAGKFGAIAMHFLSDCFHFIAFRFIKTVFLIDGVNSVLA